MASGLEDIGKENASTAGRKEAASEEADKQTVILEERIAAAISENYGAISVLFETPSGYAILGYDAVKFTKPEAWKHIWADFVIGPKAVVWRRTFKTFENKASAINDTALSPELSLMIQKNVVNGQPLAVGNEKYKNVIETFLKIDCLYSPAVKELMWGLNFQIKRYVPTEISEPTNGDLFQMSKGLELFLNSRKFEVNGDMMVTRRTILMAGVVYDCDCFVDGREDSLRSAAKYLMEISQIDTKDWDLLKLVTAFKMICYPEHSNSTAQQLFPELFDKLKKDAHLYKDKLFKIPCLELYNEIYSARKSRFDAAKVLLRSIKRATKAYEDEKRANEEHEQAGKAKSGREIGLDKEYISEARDFHLELSTIVMPTLAKRRKVCFEL